MLSYNSYTGVRPLSSQINLSVHNNTACRKVKEGGFVCSVCVGGPAVDLLFMAEGWSGYDDCPRRQSWILCYIKTVSGEAT